MNSSNRLLLIQSAADLGVPLDDPTVQVLERYLVLLNIWSARMNLTAVRDERGQVVRLLVDSLAVAPVLDSLLGRVSGKTVMDLGSGGGLPGVPVKAARPEWGMVLCESRKKKAEFLEEVARDLGLAGMSVYHGRAEDYGRDIGANQGGGVFDAVVVRGVGELGLLARTAGKLLGEKGVLVCMKGPEPADEIRSGERSLKKAGLVLRGIEYYELPEGAGRRSVVVLSREGDKNE
jgi:16S rRNA (guanine527-N7)-methyltransferase